MFFPQWYNLKASKDLKIQNGSVLFIEGINFISQKLLGLGKFACQI